MTRIPAILTDPGAGGFTDYDGILVSFVGEDGDMVALGHHDVDAATTAFNQLGDCFDEPHASWAVLVDVPDGEDAPWWMQWSGVTADTPGAFPIMVVTA